MPKKISKPEATELVVAEQQFNALSTEVRGFDRWLAVKKLADEVQFAESDRALAAVKDLLNKAEAERKELTKPLVDLKKKIDGKAKLVSGPLEELEAHIKNRLMAPYLVAKQAAAQKAIEVQAKREEKKGNEQFASDLRESVADTNAFVPESVSGLSVRENWKAKIKSLPLFLTALQQNPSLLATVEEDLIDVLEKRLSAMARAAKSADAAPAGVEYYAEKVIGKAV